MVYFDSGDSTEFHKELHDQLAADMAESRLEYNEALASEGAVKINYKRAKFLKDNPTVQKTPSDAKITKHTVIQWRKRYKTKVAERKAAKKEYDEAQKAMESFKEEDAKGHVRENDIQKHGSQYRTVWSHLPP